MSSLAIHLNTVRTLIYKYPIGKKYADLVEEKTKVNAEYFVCGLGAILVALLFIGLGAQYISNMLGFIYPVYASIRAIETSDKEDDTQWLVYWVVFSSFCLVENFVDLLKYWIPFWYPMKVTFLLWCMLPQYKGAQIIYDTVIKPSFLKHENTIDDALNAFSTKASASTRATAAKAAEATKSD